MDAPRICIVAFPSYGCIRYTEYAKAWVCVEGVRRACVERVRRACVEGVRRACVEWV